MKNPIALAVLLLLNVSANAQDVSWMLEQAPVVSRVFAKMLNSAPPFSARAEVSVTSQADPVPASALATLETSAGRIRWELRLADIHSEQFSAHAKALLTHVNGDRLALLTRPSDRVNQLVFTRARALIEQPLPNVRCTNPRSQSSETVDGHSCARERLTVRDDTDQSYEVLLWRAKDLRNVPIQFQFTQGGDVIRVKLKDVQFRTIPAQRFQTPAGLSKHETIEDLMQWVLAQKIRRRIGL